MYVLSSSSNFITAVIFLFLFFSTRTAVNLFDAELIYNYADSNTDIIILELWNNSNIKLIICLIFFILERISWLMSESFIFPVIKYIISSLALNTLLFTLFFISLIPLFFIGGIYSIIKPRKPEIDYISEYETMKTEDKIDEFFKHF